VNSIDTSRPLIHVEDDYVVFVLHHTQHTYPLGWDSSLYIIKRGDEGDSKYYVVDCEDLNKCKIYQMFHGKLDEEYIELYSPIVAKGFNNFFRSLSSSKFKDEVISMLPDDVRTEMIALSLSSSLLEGVIWVKQPST